MAYSTVEGVFRKLQQDLYDPTEIETRIEETDVDVIAWINVACRKTADFSESDLTGDDSIIRLASDCYCACRIMSEMLEGHNIDEESLAKFRCEEAKNLVRMWCAVNGVIPAFDDDAYVPVGEMFGYAIGTDEVCIG